ncbi:MAG: ATP-binding protein [Methanobrevibacter sp. CfCl-M3]
MIKLSYLYNKNIDFINKRDIVELIENDVPEDENLEFKEKINLKNKDHKRTLLKEICSFCNATGGLLVYGIGEIEEDNKEYEIKGIEIKDMDEFKLSLISVCKSNLEPNPVPFINVKELIVNGKFLLLIQCLKSINGPIRRKMKNDTTGDFYIRHNNRSDHMTIDELRNAFNLQDTLHDKIIQFKEERVKKILEDNEDNNEITLILHIIPIDSFQFNKRHDLDIIYKLNNFRTMNDGSYKIRNLDGLKTVCSESKQNEEYNLLFTNGIIESKCSVDLRNENIIPFLWIQKRIIKNVKNNLEVYKTMNVSLPVIIFLTIFGVGNRSMVIKDIEDLMLIKNQKFDRNLLNLPEAILNDYDILNNEEMLVKELEYLFNSILYAAGYPHGYNYYIK